MPELLITVFIWGLSFALAKKALNHLHPLELVTLRLFLAACAVTAIEWWLLRFRKGVQASPRSSRSTLLLNQALILGGFEFAGTYILYTWSLKYLPSGVVGALTLLTPALTFIVALVAGVQSFRSAALLGTLLSIAGALLCLPPGAHLDTFLGGDFNFSHEIVVGLMLIMASNFMFAIGNVAISVFQNTQKLSAPTTGYALWVGAAISLTVCLSVGAQKHEHNFSFAALALPLYLGVVATGLGFFLWNRGVAKTSALKASFVGNFKAPLSLVWGALLLGESLNARLAVGLVLLLLATQLVRTPALKTTA